MPSARWQYQKLTGLKAIAQHPRVGLQPDLAVGVVQALAAPATLPARPSASGAAVAMVARRGSDSQPKRLRAITGVGCGAQCAHGQQHEEGAGSRSAWRRRPQPACAGPRPWPSSAWAGRFTPPSGWSAAPPCVRAATLRQPGPTSGRPRGSHSASRRRRTSVRMRPGTRCSRAWASMAAWSNTGWCKSKSRDHLRRVWFARRVERHDDRCASTAGLQLVDAGSAGTRWPALVAVVLPRS